MLALSACCGRGAAAQTRYRLAPQATVEQRLGQYGGDDLKRERALKQMFADAGCPQLSEQPVKDLKLPNVICVLPGTSAEVLVVGAHFDHVERGAGVVDNWSGASMLPSLLESLSGERRRHTFIFIGFAGEEKGEIGSQFYVKHLSATERTKLEAMVNMDTMGLGPTKVWASRADPELVRALAGVAQQLNAPLAVVNVDRVGSTDSEQFRLQHIPAITLHSLTQATLTVLHSPQDNLKQIRLADYYESYRLVAAYLAILDAQWPPRPEMKQAAPTAEGENISRPR